MDVVKYYRENTSTTFNPIKMQGIIESFSDKVLETRIKDNKYSIANNIFCAVRSKTSLQKLAVLMDKEVVKRNKKLLTPINNSIK